MKFLLAEADHGSDHEEDKEDASPVEQKPEDSNEEGNKTGEIEDLFVGKLSKKSWQYREYQSGNATWMAAAQRRHQHRRRTGEILGTASVDLSGPHEPTPMLGSHIGSKPGHYFLALTIRPDRTREKVSRGTNPINPDNDQEEDPDLPELIPMPKGKLPFVYTEILIAKSDAAVAVMKLLARVKDDHASLPTEIVFRLHSDKGQEFLSEELEEYCYKNGIRQTTTQGYDPSANGQGENAIGYLKRKANVF